MGTSSGGEISYGVILKEDCELPWDYEQCYYDIAWWWKHVNGFKDIHLPAEVVNGPSEEPNPCILAVPGSVRLATPSCPQKFIPNELSVDDKDRDALLDFIQKYQIPTVGEPGWILSSYLDW